MWLLWLTKRIKNDNMSSNKICIYIYVYKSGNNKLQQLKQQITIIQKRVTEKYIHTYIKNNSELKDQINNCNSNSKPTTAAATTKNTSYNNKRFVVVH